ncbi:hypothetical protein LRP30_07585 [Bradyrhizobium sp. C-145]|uniref:hypothetical protein n=1 Tax=Bradyrhizobium sp. C-145 TaxID=574727 RepID=UPI00201B49BC|nr:hypothetical protein [Bradyrhizobium sp. C-145]UQR65102.1 hypothetical protein LRP30_07585 [Bradyrhizobium sp. C-145]
MANVADLFEERFDSVESGDEGVSLICAECGAAFRIPSPMDALDQGDPDMENADQIIDLIKRVLEHLESMLFFAGIGIPCGEDF